jgi:hypothetical protein
VRKTTLLTLFVTALSGLLVIADLATAEERITLGWGRLFTNDALGDGEDRWRTGSYAISRLRGYHWSGALPETPGDILEFRLRADTIAPANLQTPDPTDRRYAGALSLGMQTHFNWQGMQASLGGGLVFTGPQTGIGDFQSWAHELMGLEPPAVLDDQIENAVYPGVSAELGREFMLRDGISLRPFVAAEAGVETLARIGGDILIGKAGGALFLRDTATGLRYRGIAGSGGSEMSFTVGGDLAHVFDSALLPEGGAATLTESRGRLRAGMQWQGDRAAVFYGLTYLSPEFDEQPEGQFLGSLNVNLRF